MPSGNLSIKEVSVLCWPLSACVWPYRAVTGFIWRKPVSVAVAVVGAGELSAFGGEGRAEAEYRRQCGDRHAGGQLVHEMKAGGYV